MNDLTKPYFVMLFYRKEGWNVVAECDKFEDAVNECENWTGMMSMGNSKVRIFKLVNLTVTEARQADMTEAGK